MRNQDFHDVTDTAVAAALRYPGARNRVSLWRDLRYTRPMMLQELHFP